MHNYNKSGLISARKDAILSGNDFEYQFLEQITDSVWLANDRRAQTEGQKFLKGSSSESDGSEDALINDGKNKWVIIKLGVHADDSLRLKDEYAILEKLHDSRFKTSAHILLPQRAIPANTAVSASQQPLQHPPFLVFKFIPNAQNFYDLVKAGNQGEAFADKWSGALFDVLSLLEHEKIIHRDISPGNFLIAGHSNLYIIDFERAIEVGAPLTKRKYPGTPGYTAPEISEKYDQICCAADQYSLAAVFLYLLTGIEPINVGAGNNLQNLYDALADDLRPVLQKAMAENPQDRYATAEAFRKAWETVFTNRAHSAEQKKQWEFDEKIRLELARAKAELEKKWSENPKQIEPIPKANGPVQQSTVAVNRQSHRSSRLLLAAAFAGFAFWGYPQLKAKLQPAPVQVSADLVRTQEGDVILKRDSGFDLTRAPYQLRLTQKGECHYREAQSHPAGGLLAYRCIAEVAGEQAWQLRNNSEQLVATGDLTVAPQQMVFKPQITPANAQITLNGKPYVMGSKIPEGKYELQANAPGYKTQIHNISLQLPAQAGIQLNLQRETTPAKSQSAKTTVTTSQVYEPEMVDIPAGSFDMGDLTGNGDPDEKHVLKGVQIKAFRMSKFEITFAEYDVFAKTYRAWDGGRGPDDAGWGRGNRPVINVERPDAIAYAKWLSEKTGKKYRLPSEAEWEYAARAGTTTDYNWNSNGIDCDKARYDGGKESDCYSNNASGKLLGTAEVGSYLPNAFGLYDLHGNVWEWVLDCWDDSYKYTPLDGTPRFDCNGDYWASNGVVRGGSWLSLSSGLRVSNRYAYSWITHSTNIGFRLVQEIEPETRQAYEPEMVTIPAGNFMMGDDKSNQTNERPAHRVSIKSFKMMTRELTRGEFAQYVAATGYKTDAERNVDGPKGCYLLNGSGWKEGSSWRSVGFSQTDSHPVVCVSHNDAVAYAKWLSQQTGKRYRLPTEAEWEYAARATTTTDYSFGASIGKNQANCDGCGSQWDNKSTAPVGSFKKNKFGLYDMHGNVWEWVQDCYHDSYKAAPYAVTNFGAAWEDGTSGACTSGGRVLRGGSWYNIPYNLRSANRYGLTPIHRNDNFGFRLVQDI